MSLAVNAKELLQIYLKSVHDLSRRYYYCITGDQSVPGTLSFLLSVKETNLIEILTVCGFYNVKRGTFLRTAFKMWVGITFERGGVEYTQYKRDALLKIGLGDHPSRPVDQWKENLDPPRFRMLTAGAEGISSRDNLMCLFDKTPTTEATTT